MKDYKKRTVMNPITAQSVTFHRIILDEFIKILLKVFYKAFFKAFF